MIGTETRKAKVAITLRPEVLVRARVERGQARSVSAFIERAVEGQIAAEVDFDERSSTRMLAATGGPATAEESGAARRLLSGSAA